MKGEKDTSSASHPPPKKTGKLGFIESQNKENIKRGGKKKNNWLITDCELWMASRKVLRTWIRLRHWVREKGSEDTLM